MSQKPPNSEPSVTRRRALFSLGALGAGGVAAGCEPKWKPAKDDPFSRQIAKAPVPGSERWATGEERWATSSCGQCEAGCGIRVRVVEGRAVRIEGSPKNPINRGGIGPRGLSGLQALYDPDRVRGPLIREGGKLVPTSWDKALAAAAEGLSTLRREGTPEKLLVLTGRQHGLMRGLMERFATAFGTPNFVDGQPSHSSAIAQAAHAALGVFDQPAYHWRGVRYVLGLEAGMVEDSCQAVYFSRMQAEDARRTTYVHCGSLFDLAAHNADDWLRLEPGTSGALALGICHQLLEDGTFDAVFASQEWPDFDAFRADVRAFDPGRVSSMTGIAPQAIRRIAREMWNSRPSFALVDNRSTQTSNGLHTASAALALNALLGAIGAPEGGVFPAHRPPLASWPELAPDEVATRGLQTPRLDGAGSDSYPAARSIFETLPAAIEENPPAAAILHYCNPIFARAQPQIWRTQLARIPLVVSLSPYLDETTAELAHVVLPDHTYLERSDAVLPAPALDRAVVSLRAPAVVPLHDTRHSGDAILELAGRIGGAVAAAMPWRDYRHATEERLIGLHEADRGSVRADDPTAFLSKLRRSGVWIDSVSQPPQGPHSFSAGWEAPLWLGDEDRYPLKLYLYRGLDDAMTGGANLPWLHTMRARPGEQPWQKSAAVHPASAPGVEDGDRVTVESEWGSISIRIRLESRMQRGVVAVPLGGGHTAMGRFATGLGENPMQLCAPQPAPRSGASALCMTRVSLRKGGRHG